MSKINLGKWEIEDDQTNGKVKFFSNNTGTYHLELFEGGPLQVNNADIQTTDGISFNATLNGLNNPHGHQQDYQWLTGNDVGDDTVDYHVEVARVSTNGINGSNGSDWVTGGPVEIFARSDYYADGGYTKAVHCGNRFDTSHFDVVESGGAQAPTIYQGSLVDLGRTDSQNRQLGYWPIYIELPNYWRFGVTIRHHHEVKSSTSNIDDNGQIVYPMNYSQQSASFFDGMVDRHGINFEPQSAPATPSDGGKLFIDKSDGDLKVKFSNGNVYTIQTN